MNLNWQKWCGLAAAIVPCALVFSNLSARADDNADTLSLGVSLTSPSTITLGEPILLHYVLTNTSGQKVGVKMGIYATTWYDAVLTDDKGITMPSIPDYRPAHPSGAYSTRNMFLDKGGSISDYTVVTKYLLVKHSGRYTLSFRVHLPFALAGGTSQDTQEDPETLADSSGTALMEVFTFPITVTKPDRNQLRRTAEALQQATEKSQDGPLALADMDALFSMPEAEAAPSWRELATRPSMNTDATADRLSQLHTKAGVDILIQMCNTPNVSSRRIGEYLDQLYNTADPGLRQYIKTVAAGLGLDIPDRVKLPLHMD